jgi:SAM-dependent methyltransferase
MTTTADGNTTGYGLDNQWRAARERLGLLEAALDPITAGNLDKVGVGPGWRCLEVGAGGGSVARMLCERVGPGGHVTAVDLEVALLADSWAPNLEVRKLDVVTDELPEGAFDLVHTRAVLLHIAQRDDVLAKLVRALRPGGVLLLEEMDLSPVFEGDNELLQRCVEITYRPLVAKGAAIYWARSIPDLLAPAGLVDVGSSRELTTFTSESPMAEFFRLTWQQLLETQPYTAAERALMEEARAAILVPDQHYVAFDLITGWGSRP